MSFWGLVMEAAERMEKEKTADGRNIKNNQEENKMKYENELAYGCVAEDMKAVEDLTGMLNETRAMAQEAGRLVNKIGEHFFGHRGEAACCGEGKCAEPANFKESLSEVRTSLKSTIDDLEKMCTLIGV